MNYSLFQPSRNQEEALSAGLKSHIPSTSNKFNFFSEFESFYKQFNNKYSDLPKEDQIEIKSKIVDTAVKYNNIKLPIKHKSVIKDLQKNKDITIMKEDKGKCTVILDETQYAKSAQKS